MRYLIVLAAFALLPLSGAAQQYYSPDEPGHGVAVQRVGEAYTLQWFFHDGQSTGWVVSDLCLPGEVCEAFTVDAVAFPAAQAALVDAGAVEVLFTDGGLEMTYDIDIPALRCSDLPGPLPPGCYNNDGERDRSIELRKGLQESGELILEVLVE